MYSSITALHASHPIVSQIWDTAQRGSLAQGAKEVRCKSALSAGGACSHRNGSSRDLPLHFHCSLIESLLKPNQQVCSRLVSGFLPYPQGLWNGGQWVCYCFSSASLSPHSSVMSTVKWQREPGPGKKKKKQRGNNCYYDLGACLLSTGLQLFQWAWTRTHMKKGRAVNITYPPTGWNETAAADRELLKILSPVWNVSLNIPELSLRWCTTHCVLSFLVRWFNM